MSAFLKGRIQLAHAEEGQVQLARLRFANSTQTQWPEPWHIQPKTGSAAEAKTSFVSSPHWEIFQYRRPEGRFIATQFRASMSGDDQDIARASYVALEFILSEQGSILCVSQFLVWRMIIEFSLALWIIGFLPFYLCASQQLSTNGPNCTGCFGPMCPAHPMEHSNPKNAHLLQISMSIMPML